MRDENTALESRNAQLQERRTALQEVARKTQGMMSHMRKELLWLSEEKDKVMQEGKETIEKDREKHRWELAKVLTREQDLLAQALVTTAVTAPSGRYATRGSPRRRVAPSTTPGRSPRAVRFYPHALTQQRLLVRTWHQTDSHVFSLCAAATVPRADEDRRVVRLSGEAECSHVINVFHLLHWSLFPLDQSSALFTG